MKSIVLIVSITVGCGGGPDQPANDAPVDGDPLIVDAPPIPPGFTRLIGRTWTLPGGALDTYRCVRVTIPQDMYITNIVAQAPTGTHHTVLSIAGSNGTSGPDGEQNCDVGTLGMVMLYASGLGTSPLDFPAGVGIKVSAGQQIHLNLHLFNATDDPIGGDSAILVKSQTTAPPTLAEMVFAGKFLFSIGTGPRIVQGGCTAQAPFTLFALWPHQHRLGTNQKFEQIRGGDTTTLHDAPYDFNEQSYYLQTPEVAIQQGDQLRVTCSYNNTTGGNVTFGESSDDEMCFAGMYRYPAANAGLFQCTDNPGF